ncbi:uncharacterized protein [Montipora foliosa]|uniref:uncharacterized protein isoform X2 n=1 Tax=Montipora foliosa TaxID=591990 RepID=UPI0035F16CE7
MTATESNPLLEKYMTLDEGERVQVMNVWIDGTGESMRRKTKTVESEPLTPEDLPVWNFDGSSTYQAEGFNSDLYLRPGTLFRDPFRLRKNKNVFSETYNFDHKPRVANHRPSCSLFMERKLLEVCITGADRLSVVVPNRDPRKLSLAMVSPDGKIGECAGSNKKSSLSVEVCVVLKLDNKVVGKTSWKAPGTECWKEQFRIKLDKSRELKVEVYWRDHRSLCGVAFLRLEELLDNQRRQIQVPLEPQGCLFAEVTFLNPTVPKKRRPRRQKRAFHFHKDAEKKFPRAGQKNTTFNVATRDRLQKTTALPDCTTNNSTLSPHSTSSPFPRDRAESFVEQAPLLDYGKVTEELESSHTDNLTRGQQELRYTSVREEKPIQNCEKKPMIQENRNKDDCSTAASRSSFSDSYNHSSIDQPRASYMRRNSKRKKSLCGPIDSLTEIEIPQINGIRYAQGPNGEVEDKVNQEEPIIINSPYSCKGFHQTMLKVERPLDEINESEDLRGKGVTFLSKSWDIVYSILRCIFLCLVLILGFLLYRIWCASCWSVTLFEWIKRFTRSEKKDSRQGQTYDGPEDMPLAQLPSNVVESVMSDSCHPEEIVRKLKESLHLDEKCLEQPNPETKRTIRRLAKLAKDSNRIEVVKYLRKITPAGTTGPLLPGNLGICNIPVRQMRELTIYLSGGDEWKDVAEKLGFSPIEIRFLDKRTLNPFDEALAFISKRCRINVDDLYDALTDCGYPVLADTL